MSYKVTKNDKGTFDIIEVDTDTTIELRTSEERARGLCRKLNLGSGFAGWTPSFVAVGYELTGQAY
jgi:hypothetical protein